MLRVIGRGSYGEIWLARSLTGALRAVKIVYRSNFESERAFNREFEGMSSFEPISRAHDGFVDILHVGRAEKGSDASAAPPFFYYIMELADDCEDGAHIDARDYTPKTLKSELDRRKRLPAAECIRIGLLLTEALDALHSRLLSHRDIKPANIIFVHGVPKLADIGLVAVSGQRSFVGTEGYVPPEGPGTPQADIYSLGKVLYEISMGKDRFEFPELMTSLDDQPDKGPLLRMNPILLKACANDPRKRYQSAREMRDDLLLLENGKRPRSVPARHRLVPMLVLLAVLLAGGLFFLQQHRAPGPVTFTVRTEPPEAMVILGDRMIKSPARFENIEPGSYPLRVMQPGFEPVETRLDVKPGIEPAPLKLVRSKGALQLSSQPGGGEFVLLDGTGKSIRTGTTPATIPGLVAGVYDVVVRQSGRELRERVEIKRNETTGKEFVFAAGSVVVGSEPPGAKIFVDGEARGAAPLRIELPTGAHRITAEFDNRPPEERQVTVERGRDAAVNFEFSNGSVKITSAPGGAAVFCTGTEIGRTPLLIEEVKPGAVVYELRMTGFKPAVLRGNVLPNQQTFLAERLEQKRSPQPGKPWENSLGMKFTPVGEALFCVWKTRVKDYDAFCAATGHSHDRPDFKQTDTHPVVLVNWQDAQAFCKWLTEKERAANLIEENQSYRLPTDAEWSFASGLPDEGGATPEERDGRMKGEFPWGKNWPPPAGAGNYADASARRQGIAVIAGYTDGFPQTSPVGSFPANRLGLFDIGGNAWEWVQEGYKGSVAGKSKDWGVLRGASWANGNRAELQSSYRNVIDRNDRDVIFGFRCVLVFTPGGAGE